MPSDHDVSKISKQEKVDRIIAVVVVILFLGATVLFLWEGDEPEQREEAVQPTTVLQEKEDTIEDQLTQQESEELIEEIQIEGTTYKVERKTSRNIDMSYHQRAADESLRTSGIIDTLELDGSELGKTILGDEHNSIPSDRLEEQDDTAVEELVEEVVAPVSTIANTASSAVQEAAKQPVVETLESIERKTVEAPPTECVIIIGAYKSASNISKLSDRLERDNYDHFTTPYKNLIRVGVRVSCDNESYEPILQSIRRSYAQDAVLLQPK
jgi:hypothetical protein